MSDKFKKGEVVAVQRSDGRTEYCKIVEFERWQNKLGFNVKVIDTDCEWIPIENLRPLTARERGRAVRETKGRK